MMIRFKNEFRQSIYHSVCYITIFLSSCCNNCYYYYIAYILTFRAHPYQELQRDSPALTIGRRKSERRKAKMIGQFIFR